MVQWGRNGCAGQQFGTVSEALSVKMYGRNPVRTKIVIDNKIIEQINSFNYLGNMISYEK
jgi:hypothetical protein